jgi:hypothetical protein
MLVLDPSMLLAIAALVSSLSAFVWAGTAKALNHLPLTRH